MGFFGDSILNGVCCVVDFWLDIVMKLMVVMWVVMVNVEVDDDIFGVDLIMNEL